MSRDPRIARPASLTAFVAGFFVATDAFAAEGGLVLVPELDTLLVLVAVFVLLVYPVNRLLFQPIFRVLDEREEKIDGTRRDAERLAREAEGVLERYEQSVREVRMDAERDRKATLEQARADGAARTGEARGEAESEVNRARTQVAAALEDARATLREQSAGLARDIAARALGRTLS
jgi:F-type H+-transporting ATPase subunit b